MKTKELLLEQFAACFDKNDWFVALKNTLTHVTAEQAIWKRKRAIIQWGILRHLNFYNEAYLTRFKGIDYVYPTSDNSETFSISEGSSEADWESELTRIDSIMTEWSNLLAIADEIKFDQPVSKTNDSFWSSIISNINVHNAHHAGQIVLLRKLQGSWDTQNGVS